MSRRTEWCAAIDEMSRCKNTFPWNNNNKRNWSGTTTRGTVARIRACPHFGDAEKIKKVRQKGIQHEPWTRKPASPPRSDARAESQTSAAVAQTQTMKRRRRPQSGARASRPRAESLFPPRRWVSGRRLKATSEPQRTALCYLLLFPWIDRPPGPSSMCTPSG